MKVSGPVFLTHQLSDPKKKRSLSDPVALQRSSKELREHLQNGVPMIPKTPSPFSSSFSDSDDVTSEDSFTISGSETDSDEESNNFISLNHSNLPKQLPNIPQVPGLQIPSPDQIKTPEIFVETTFVIPTEKPTTTEEIPPTTHVPQITPVPKQAALPATVQDASGTLSRKSKIVELDVYDPPPQPQIDQYARESDFYFFFLIFFLGFKQQTVVFIKNYN